MAKAKKGDLFTCELCGIVVAVDESCDCVVGELICCDIPMEKGKAKMKKAAKPAKKAKKPVQAKKVKAAPKKKTKPAKAKKVKAAPKKKAKPAKKAKKAASFIQKPFGELSSKPKAKAKKKK